MKTNRPVSKKTYENLCLFIPGGVNSPVRSCKNMGQMPLVADHGFEDTIVGVDGDYYLDYCGSWGALIHGHAHPQIIEAVTKRLKKGTSFGVTTALEGELAKAIIQQIPSIEKIRFVSSGTEATMSAVRLARGFTQKELIIKFNGHYHGHADFFLVEAGSGVLEISRSASSAGIPKDVVKQTICLPFNDIDSCKNFFSNPENRNQIAAVILEPIAGNMGVVPAKNDFIHFLREETKKMGSLLIFDEVMTGFRVAKKGAQEIYQVTPDLTCFGKIIGGGFPAAAFGGRKEIMDYLAPLGPVYQAGTLSGNPIAMEAGLTSLQLLQEPGFYKDLERKATLLIQPIERFIQTENLNACVQRAGSMFTLFFGRKSVQNLQEALECDNALFAHFFRFLFERGIYIPPSQHEAWFISSAHQDSHLKETSEAVISFLKTELKRPGLS